ncbi:MAG: hypothetical protein V7752_07185 [Halopseudomonas sp.]
MLKKRRGNPRFLEVRYTDTSRATAKKKELADDFAVKMTPLIRKLEADGYTSLGSISHALNELEERTRRGKRWTKTAVRNLKERMSAARTDSVIPPGSPLAQFFDE